MKNILTTLILVLSLNANQAGFCPKVTGVDSPIQVVNHFLDDFFNTYDRRTKAESIQIVQVLENPDKTKYKILLQVVDLRNNFVKYFIGLKTEVVQENGKDRHKILQFVQSEDSVDVVKVLMVPFTNDRNINCTREKQNFLSYFVGNNTILEYFVTYYNIDAVNTKTREITKETQISSEAQLKINNLESIILSLEHQIRMITENKDGDMFGETIKRMQEERAEDDDIIKKLTVQIENLTKNQGNDNADFAEELAEMKRLNKELELKLEYEIKGKDQEIYFFQTQLKDQIKAKDQELEARLADLKLQHDQEIDRIRELKTSESTLLNDQGKFEIEKWKQSHQSLQIELAEAKAELKENEKDKETILNLKAELLQKEREIEDVQEETDLKIVKLQKDHAKNLNDLQNLHQQTLQATSNNLKIKLRDQELKYIKEIELIKTQNQTRIKLLEEQFANDLLDKEEELDTENQKEIEKYTLLVEKAEDSLNKLREEHELAIKNFELNKKIVISQLMKEKEEELDELKRRKELRLKEMDEKYQNMLEEYRNALKKEAEKIRLSNEKKVVALTKEQEAEIERLKNQHIQNIAKIEKNYELELMLRTEEEKKKVIEFKNQQEQLEREIMERKAQEERERLSREKQQLELKLRLEREEQERQQLERQNETMADSTSNAVIINELIQAFNSWIQRYIETNANNKQLTGEEKTRLLRQFITTLKPNQRRLITEYLKVNAIDGRTFNLNNITFNVFLRTLSRIKRDEESNLFAERREKQRLENETNKRTFNRRATEDLYNSWAIDSLPKTVGNVVRLREERQNKIEVEGDQNIETTVLTGNNPFDLKDLGSSIGSSLG